MRGEQPGVTLPHRTHRQSFDLEYRSIFPHIPRDDSRDPLCAGTKARFLRTGPIVPTFHATCQKTKRQRGYNRDSLGVEWERPTCDKCGWAGEPVRIDEVVEPLDQTRSTPPDGECIIPSATLRQLKRPKPKTE
jgi:hypothetical protein